MAVGEASQLDFRVCTMEPQPVDMQFDVRAGTESTFRRRRRNSPALRLEQIRPKFHMVNMKYPRQERGF